MVQAPPLTCFMCEHRLAHGARPHAQAVRQLRRFRVARQVLAQRALVHVVFAADGARMVGGAALGQVLVVGRQHCGEENEERIKSESSSENSGKV